MLNKISRYLDFQGVVGDNEAEEDDGGDRYQCLEGS